MNLQRLVRMKPAEFAFRGRQHAHKTMDRLSRSWGDRDPEVRVRFDNRQCDARMTQIVHQLRHGQPGSAVLQLQQRLGALMPDRFFAGAGDQRLADLLKSGRTNPDRAVRDQIVAGADAVCRGEFDILGYGRLSFGAPVNWRIDPISGRESPSLHWSRIDPLALEQVGDSKVVWELNRHQWILELGQAYRLTSDERYARCFASLVTDWMHTNPPGMGINWSSSLEMAMRLISWCWALLLFRGSEALTPDLFHTLLGWMQNHARNIERYLSQYFSPNTHLTGEALGLFYLGVLVPELHGADRWRTIGGRILGDQMHQQVHSDGVYFEQSTCYQFYTIEIYLHFILLAERNRVTLPDGIHDCVRKLVAFLLHVRRPDGSIPQIGDTDGGWLLPLLRRQRGDFHALFSTAAVVLRSSEFAWAAGALAPETRWLIGTSSETAWGQLNPAQPSQSPMRAFRTGGYMVMRSSWASNAHQLIFDTGPLGCEVSGGHGHADLLSIQCSAFGENYLVDPGTCCYTADPVWRAYFRSSNAHNTLLVDEKGQAEPNGAFSWHSRPRAMLRSRNSKPGCLVADAEHAAFGSANAPIKHRRRVMFLDSSYWIVVDDLTGSGEHCVDLRYQFAPMPVSSEDGNWVRASGAESALLVKVFSNCKVRMRIGLGELNPMLGWYSPNYGQRVPAPAMTCTAVAHLPLRLVTLILPLQDATAAVPVVVPIHGQKSITGLVFPDSSRPMIRI